MQRGVARAICSSWACLMLFLRRQKPIRACLLRLGDPAACQRMQSSADCFAAGSGGAAAAAAGVVQPSFGRFLALNVTLAAWPIMIALLQVEKLRVDLAARDDLSIRRTGSGRRRAASGEMGFQDGAQTLPKKAAGSHRVDPSLGLPQTQPEPKSPHTAGESNTGCL